MRDELRLAISLVELGLARNRAARVKGRIAGTALMIVAAICACAAGIFGLIALWIYSVPMLGTAGAALLIAAALLVCGAALLVVGRCVTRRAFAATASPALDLQSLIDDASALVRANKGVLLLAAFVAGILASERNDRAR